MCVCQLLSICVEIVYFPCEFLQNFDQINVDKNRDSLKNVTKSFQLHERGARENSRKL